MGKSAKFYKRPSKKEKEGIALKKLVEPTAISKKKAVKETKTISVPVEMFKSQKAEQQDNDIDMDSKPVVKKKQKEAELPDYVDLF